MTKQQQETAEIDITAMIDVLVSNAQEALKGIFIIRIPRHLHLDAVLLAKTPPHQTYPL